MRCSPQHDHVGGYQCRPDDAVLSIKVDFEVVHPAFLLQFGDHSLAFLRVMPDIDLQRRFSDNLVGGEVISPARVVRKDADDTYLVVAADKGTATFSDIANELSEQYGFWLGDAFASGGSAGYDNPAVTLGSPERMTGEVAGFPGVVSMFSGPFGTDEIFSIGTGGHLTVSLGVAAYPEDASTAQDLIHMADQALYDAKDRGRNQVRAFQTVG